MTSHVGHRPELVAPDATPESGKPALAKPASLGETSSARLDSRSFEADRATGDCSANRASLAIAGLPAVSGGDTTARLDTKVVATLKARCALVGVVLHLGDDDHGAPLFIVSKWAMTRQLSGVGEVERFLRGIGGQRAGAPRAAPVSDRPSEATR